MSEINRSALFGKLNSVAYKGIEGATVLCKLRGNPYVELVHWIQQILNSPDSDMHRIIRHFEVDSSRLACRAARRPFPISRRTSRTRLSAAGSTRR
jgi:type VI secretion system protein VasG